ncbi:MAG: hypothetical protein PHD88_02615 [Firmicutes bacterium]|nr:hypothetical protein [Bacillota bacterium]MDD4263965.1 hypothetical protein [Bacillota bacterium]MDD4693285.1 hypothetical protein [Bacillota bacterium]
MERLSTRGLVAILVFVAVVLTGCNFLPTRAPSWEADYQIPLVVSQTTTDELFSDSPLNNDGEHYFITESVSGSFTLGLDNLNLDDFASVASVQFPILDLGNILSSNIHIASVPVPDLLNGTSVPLGTIDFPEYELVGVKEGSLSLLVENTGDSPISFGVTLAFTDVTLEIVVENLLPQTTQNITKSLNNLTLDNQANVTIVNPQVDAGTANLSLSISALEINSLASIKGYDADLNITVSNTFSLPEDSLDKIEVGAGLLQVSTSPVDALSMNIKTLSLDGTALDLVEANTFSLAGKTINSGALLEANFDIAIDGNILFNIPDEVTLSASVSGLQLQSVTLDNLTVSLKDAAPETIDIPNISLDEPFNEVRLSGASLTLLLEQNLGDLRYDDLFLNVVLKDSSAYPVRIDTIADTGLEKEIVFMSDDVTRLINDIIAGDVTTITIDGEITASGPVTISQTSTVDYVANIYLPFKLEGNQSLEYSIDTDPQTIELDENSKRLLADSLGGVKLEAEIENGLPIGLDIVLQLKNQSTVIATLEGQVQSGITDENGVATQTKKSVVVMELGSSQVRSLLEAGVLEFYPTLTLNVPENGALIKLDDSIKIRALLLVNVQINRGRD